MYSISFGVGSQASSVAQILMQVDQQIKSNELEHVGEFVEQEDQKLLHGEPTSIYDYYA
ncbi:hypothetical protein [Alicyclobacillus fodiniaquatilis]|uniref:Uncharacterized protein n=1 Tax=Alicyclobacillus fodiniaquatilis TaxID=1661150 RepID=A0ABW4JQ35_9BACL